MPSLRRFLASAVVAALVVACPGLAPYQAVAAEFEGRPGAPISPVTPPVRSGAQVPGEIPTLAPSAPDAAQTQAQSVPSLPAAGSQAPQAEAQPEAAAARLEAAAQAEARLAQNPAQGSGEQAARQADFTLPGNAFLGDDVAAAPSGWRSLALSKVRGVAHTAHDYLFGEREMAKINKARQPDIAKTRRLLIADGGLSIVLSLLIGPLIDTARTAASSGIGGHVGTLVGLTAGILSTFAVYVWVEWRHTLLKQVTGLFSARDYRVALADNLMRQELDFHQEKEHSSTALGKRVLGDTNYLEIKNQTGPLSIVANSVYVAFGTAMMFYVHAPLAAVITTAAIGLGIYIAISGSKMTKMSFQQSDDQAELMRRSQESLSQAQTVKSFANEAGEAKHYSSQAEGLFKTSMRLTSLGSKVNMLAGAVTSFFTSYLVYIVGGYLAVMHRLSFGQVVQMSIFASFASMGLMNLGYAILLVKSNEGSSKVVRELLLRKPKITDSPDARVLADLKGDIAFEDVSFTYPSRKSEGKTLDGVSFEAKAGETVAFVGETGSGKSTITRLLLRLWDPQAGRILVDGQDLKGVRRQSFLDRVAVVPQDTRLFSNTIRYNMTYGSENVSEERLSQAVRMAKAEFVYNKQLFPKGLDTPVSEGGERLSGGERQRIAIVRALLRQPSLLILDEATSALDNASEKVVQQALDGLAQGQAGRKPTTIVIAHRLTTVKNADRIYVLDKGCIVEAGSHAELLAKGGRYAALWKKGGYDEDASATPAAPQAEEKPETPAEAAAPEQPQPKPEAVGLALIASMERAQLKADFVEGRIPLPRRVILGILGQELFRRLSLVSVRVRRFPRKAWITMRPWFFGDRILKPLMRRYRLALAGTAALMTLDAGLWIFSSTLLKRMLDAAEAALNAGGTAAFGASLSHMAWLIVGTLAVLIGLDWATAWLSGMLKNRTLRDIREKLMETLLRREMAFHIRHDSGELASRVSEDAEGLARKNVDDRLPLIRNGLTLVLSSALLLHASLIFGLIVLAVSVGVGKINGYWGQKAESTYEEFVKRRAEYGRTTQETFEHIQTVKMFGQESAEVKRNEDRAEALARSGVPSRRAMANAHMFSSSLTDFFTKYAPYIGGAWLAALAMGVGLGTIIAMTFYAGFIKSSVDALSSAWMDYKQSHGETSVIRRWLAQRPGVRDARDARPLSVTNGAVRFENVGFRYSEDGKGGGLSGFSLDVPAGQTVAFVGETGSGKSTTLRLLQRLWDPKAGRVLIDGQDVAKVTLESLNRQIAVVPQETRLFNESLRYNMLYGNEQASESDLLAAIRAAKADFVFDQKAFPDGLKTRVGEGGSTLSGGQAQRVAIVRAILKKARILLLDEATAKLDKQTEKEIQETLDHVVGGAGAAGKPTTLVVAHNLTTIMNADRIVVLGAGRILEQGTHQQLLARRGAYYRLWQAAQQPR